MTRDEYNATTEQIGLIGRMAAALDLDGYLEVIDRAEAFGPILDPTLYRQVMSDARAVADLRASKEIARALRTVQREVQKLAEIWGVPVMSPPVQEGSDE